MPFAVPFFSKKFSTKQVRSKAPGLSTPETKGICRGPRLFSAEKNLIEQKVRSQDTTERETEGTQEVFIWGKNAQELSSTSESWLTVTLKCS